MENRVTSLFGIKYPVICGGMVWCSGARLAAAVSNAGGLGLIGAGSMYPDVFREHVRGCKDFTDKPFGINIPLMCKDVDQLMKIVIEEGVKIVFTSAGNPTTWTSILKNAGITVVHVVSSSAFARKAEAAGVDAVVAEGFEAGGHNGREETTTFVLVPAVKRAVGVPVIAAGGVSLPEHVSAAFALGAEGVQVGTRFALSCESSADEAFKKRCLSLPEGDTMLCLKKLGSIRLVKNDIYNRIKSAEDSGADLETLRGLVGQRRAKLGVFEGELSEGFLEIGQTATLVSDIESAKEIVLDLASGI